MDCCVQSITDYLGSFAEFLLQTSVRPSCFKMNGTLQQENPNCLMWGKKHDCSVQCFKSPEDRNFRYLPEVNIALSAKEQGNQRSFAKQHAAENCNKSFRWNFVNKTRSKNICTPLGNVKCGQIILHLLTTMHPHCPIVRKWTPLWKFSKKNFHQMVHHRLGLYARVLFFCEVNYNKNAKEYLCLGLLR